MNKALVAVLAIVSAFALWSAYTLIDTGITSTYMKVGYESRVDEVLQLRSMLRHAMVNLDRADVLRLLDDDIKRAVIVKEMDDGLYIDSIGFVFRADKLADVRLLNEPAR